MDKLQKLVESGAVEKSTLIVAGVGLISTGTATLSQNEVAGIIIIVLGVVCLITREVLKAFQK